MRGRRGEGMNIDDVVKMLMVILGRVTKDEK